VTGFKNVPGTIWGEDLLTYRGLDKEFHKVLEMNHVRTNLLNKFKKKRFVLCVDTMIP
jgi:hypothetical protein